jgi:4-hydroxy-tetrahydrodipicolinate synthase
MDISGSIVALVTPMCTDGSIDKHALAKLIDWHLQSKTNALVLTGTTGEGSTLTADEQIEIIRIAVKQVAGRMPIIAGTGSNSTAHTLTLTQNAKLAGANAALVVTPYYNKPTQNGLFAHYQIVAKNSNFPIILYNVPSRTACDLLPETVARLMVLPNIIGLKEASGNLTRVQELVACCHQDFRLYSGDDATNLEFIMAGGHGVISVTANIAPAQMQWFCQAALAGQKDLAAAIHQELMPLHKNLFIQSNPIPIKWALAKMGLISTGIRLPLEVLDEKFQPAVTAAMLTAGIIHSESVNNLG